jgi:cell division protein FtsB
MAVTLTVMTVTIVDLSDLEQQIAVLRDVTTSLHRAVTDLQDGSAIALRKIDELEQHAQSLDEHILRQ